MLAAGVFMNMKTTEASGASTATASTPAAAPAEAAPKEKDSAVTALSSSVDALKAEVAALTKEVKDLEGRLEGHPKPAPPSDLAPLQRKVDEVATATQAVASLPRKVSELDGRLGELDKLLQEKIAAVRNDLAGVKGELKRVGETAASTPSTGATRPVDVNVEGQAMSQGAELFKAGKYREAGEVFRTAEANDPKDARVWYYAALSHGMATNQWNGETERLVNKGVEREKVGTPRSSEIDSEFAKLPSAQKNWLDYYRKNARK
jgi:hypothetical protein